MLSLKSRLDHFYKEKLTLMFVFQNSKDIISFHISKIKIIFFATIISMIIVLGFFFTFQLESKKNEYQKDYVENIYYEKMIGKIRKILPKIEHLQTFLTKNLKSLFNSLGFVDSTNKYSAETNTINNIKNYNNKIRMIPKYIKSYKQLFRDIPSVFPLITKNFFFTSAFGYRTHPIRGTTHFHSGLDIAALPSTPIKSTADGIIEFASRNMGYGLMVTVKHKYGFSTKYPHMSKIAVQAGDFVKRGQIVGYVGMSGSATGYHLHYEVLHNNKPINPYHYLYLNKF